MATADQENRKQLFLELLFTDVEDGGAGGNFFLAKKLAGYADTTSTTYLKKAYKKDIEEATRNFLGEVGPEATFSIIGVMRNPVQMGAKEKLAAAKDLLDRGGFGKVEKVDISTNGGGLFILPPKEEADDT